MGKAEFEALAKFQEFTYTILLWYKLMEKLHEVKNPMKNAIDLLWYGKFPSRY